MISVSSFHVLEESSFFYMFICLFILAVLGLHCCVGFSLVAGSRGYSLAPMYRLLIAVASRCGAQVLGHVQASVVAVPTL